MQLMLLFALPPPPPPLFSERAPITLQSYNAYTFLSFLRKPIATIPLYFHMQLFLTFFTDMTSLHTLSSPVSLRLYICISLSLLVITFCSPGLCRLTPYPLPHIFIAS